MTHLYRVRAHWTGFPGAPGISTFYLLDVATAVASVKTMFDALAYTLPSDVHIQCESAGDVIEDTTGELVGAWGADPVSESVGNRDGVYSAPAGCIISWETSTILASHRLRGRTFLVPMSGDSYQTDGSLNNGTVTLVEAAALNFAVEQTDSLVIWHRPREAKPADGSRPAVTARIGGHGLVTLTTVPDKSVVLRSRRD